jgi:hypothetical protein
MLGVDEYVENLLAALVHLRIFELSFSRDHSIKDGHPFTMKVSDRVPHLEYFSMPHLEYFSMRYLEYLSMPDLNCYYKRVGGELVICDRTEFP